MNPELEFPQIPFWKTKTHSILQNPTCLITTWLKGVLFTSWITGTIFFLAATSILFIDNDKLICSFVFYQINNRLGFFGLAG